MANHRCAVLGKPVAHSLSPVLHNAAYRSLKLDDWLYDKHEVGEDDLDAFLKVVLGRTLATKTNSAQGSLVDDFSMIGTGGTGRRAGDGSEVYARLGLHIFGVELENRLAPGEVGQLDRHAAIEAARAQERGVEGIGAVRRGENHDALLVVKAVHFREKLI